MQNVFISNSGLVENVGTLISLDQNDMVQLLMNQAPEVDCQCGGRPFIHGGRSRFGALGVLVEQLAKDRGPSAGDFSVALNGARQKMSVCLITS